MMQDELPLRYSNERIWLEDGSGRIIAEIDFPETAPGVVNIVHTEVDSSLQGQGIAGRLTKAAAEKLREEHRTAVLTCSYAVRWFSDHPEYVDVLNDPEAESKRAGLFGGPACGLR